jgi:hypothetical protein
MQVNILIALNAGNLKSWDGGYFVLKKDFAAWI